MNITRDKLDNTKQRTKGCCNNPSSCAFSSDYSRGRCKRREDFERASIEERENALLTTLSELNHIWELGRRAAQSTELGDLAGARLSEEERQEQMELMQAASKIKQPKSQKKTRSKGRCRTRSLRL